MGSIRVFAAAKESGRKLSVVTAYDAWTARLLAIRPWMRSWSATAR